MSMELIQRELIMETQIYSSKESMSITMKQQVLLLWIIKL